MFNSIRKVTSSLYFHLTDKYWFELLCAGLTVFVLFYVSALHAAAGPAQFAPKKPMLLADPPVANNVILPSPPTVSDPEEPVDLSKLDILKHIKITTKRKIFHHPDPLSGTSVDTDEDGNLIGVHDYQPYGEERVNQNYGDYQNNHLFTGKEQDADTGLYYYGMRYYDPITGRFVSQDSMLKNIDKMTQSERNVFLSDPQNLNPYSYARNNPVRYNDPTGAIPKSASFLDKAWSIVTFDNFGKGAGWLANSAKQFAANPNQETRSELASNFTLAVDRFVQNPLSFADETWDPVTNKRIDTLDSRVQVPATDFINVTEEKEGKTFRISDAYRSFAQQDELFKKNITPAKGGESYHNYGLAIDAAEMKNGDTTGIRITKAIAEIAKSFGFEWGGDWLGGKNDPPHFQMPFGKSTQELEKSHKK